MHRTQCNEKNLWDAFLEKCPGWLINFLKFQLTIGWELKKRSSILPKILSAQFFILIYLCLIVSNCQFNWHSFDVLSNLVNNMWVFSSELFCKICKRDFPTERAALMHRKRIHERAPDDKKQRCKICKKMIKISYMRTHMQTIHSKDRFFNTTRKENWLFSQPL